MTAAGRAHPWMPSSPCGPSCLEAGAPAVPVTRRVLRIVAVVAVVGGLLLVAPALFLLRRPARHRAVRWLFRAVLRAFGVRLLVHGEFGAVSPATGPGRGALVVNNHISWLDIVAVNAVHPMPALAKREIGDWPLLGGLVRRGGTVFLDRERLTTLPATIDELTRALRGGALVSVTPEGTTWCGPASGRFTTAAFQAAIDGGVPVRPLALRYRLADGRETAEPAFIGPETLIESMRRVIRLRGLVLEVFVCPEIAPGRAADRRELAALAEGAVHAALGVVRLRQRGGVANSGTRARKLATVPECPASSSPVPSSTRP
jgi:1-acyl-sn-glycerol-3-phosphate acyltransferase